MRNSSQIMYKIGRIFSFILVGLYALLAILNTIWLIVHIVDGASAAGITSDVLGIVFALIWIALTIVCIVLATKAIKDMQEDAKNNQPHIIMIVFGAICGDVFYVLGGIFGLIANNQEKNEEQPKE